MSITLYLMTRIKVKSGAQLLGIFSHVMSESERNDLLGGGQLMPSPFSFLMLTLGDYGAMVASDDFLGIVERCRQYHIGEDGKQLASLSARECLAWMRFVYAEQKKVESAFRSIPEVGLSLDEMASGFDSLRFGLFGLVDRMARRQSITDDQARQLRISDVIGKLTIDAKTAICQKNIQRLWQQRQTKTSLRG